MVAFCLFHGRYVVTYSCYWASLVAQRLKRLPGMWKTWVRSLGQGRSPGEGNGNPLQYSFLENPMEGGAWYPTVHGVHGVHGVSKSRA